MRILLLGGISEARQLAQHLTQAHGHQSHFKLIYSLAGLTQAPPLSCEVRTGGFGDIEGLIDYIQHAQINLVIDATHPYAQQMSQQVKQATTSTHTRLWALRRPPWQAGPTDDWSSYQTWPELLLQLKSYQRVLMTLGRTPLPYLATIPRHQHWTLRRLPTASSPQSHNSQDQYTHIYAKGPFTLENEIALLQQHHIDVLVSKNSGGTAVATKLLAARTLSLPVILLQRPQLPAADHAFDRWQHLSTTLTQLIETQCFLDR